MPGIWEPVKSRSQICERLGQIWDAFSSIWIWKSVQQAKRAAGVLWSHERQVHGSASSLVAVKDERINAGSVHACESAEAGYGKACLAQFLISYSCKIWDLEFCLRNQHHHVASPQRSVVSSACFVCCSCSAPSQAESCPSVYVVQWAVSLWCPCSFPFSCSPVWFSV